MVPLQARPAALWIRLYSLCIKTQQLFISLMILLAAGRSLAQVFRAKSTKVGGRCQETNLWTPLFPERTGICSYESNVR